MNQKRYEKKGYLSQALFCYDLETTGLNLDNLEIIERYFEEYNLGFVPSEGLIKPNNYISQNITEITKITKPLVTAAIIIAKVTSVGDKGASKVSIIFPCILAIIKEETECEKLC